MTVKLNEVALSHAHGLLRRNEITHDERDDWSKHAPSTDENNAFIKEHGMAEYAKWHLGEDTEETDGTKGSATCSHTVTSRSCTVARSFLVKAAPVNTIIWRSRRR
jgi:hypothetical protein